MAKNTDTERDRVPRVFTETLFSCIFNKSTLYTIYVSTHHISTPYICTLYLQCVCAGSAWSSCRCCPASPSSSSTSSCSPPCAGPSSAGAASPSTGAVVLSAHAQYVISNTSEPTTTPRRGATRSAAPSWAGQYYLLLPRQVILPCSRTRVTPWHKSLVQISSEIKGSRPHWPHMLCLGILFPQQKKSIRIFTFAFDDFIHL